MPEVHSAVDAYLRARRVADEANRIAAEAYSGLDGMSPQQINALSVGEYASLTGRPTPGEAARAALYGPETPAETQADPTPAPVAPDAPTAPSDPFEGLDPDSPEFFLAWRASRHHGGEGRGIFDSVSSRSAEYQAAARKQAGRTGWVGSNTVEAPRIGRAYVADTTQLDSRPASERFSGPANFFRG